MIISHEKAKQLNALHLFTAELGDYHPEEHGPGYLSQLQLIPGQTEEMEKKISELHKLHKFVYFIIHAQYILSCKSLTKNFEFFFFSRGQLPADAEFNFLDHAKRLDMYGVELHKARVHII